MDGSWNLDNCQLSSVTYQTHTISYMSEQVWLVVALWQIEEVKEPTVIQVGEFQPIPSKMLPS